ncbi:Cutinase [Naviculisporaceae sp. PSN 640]
MPYTAQPERTSLSPAPAPTPPGPGVMGVDVVGVAAQIPFSNIASVDYPATLDNYHESETDGVKEMRRQVTEYATACPSSKMVLMGYSQGAQVTADVVCGTSEAGFPQSDPLPTNSWRSNPSHVANATFNRGSSTRDGRYPRQNTTAGYAAVAHNMVSYCTIGDEYCDDGNVEGVHQTYQVVYGVAATKFVVEKYYGTKRKQRR